jgi:hypothetical protein
MVALVLVAGLTLTVTGVASADRQVPFQVTFVNEQVTLTTCPAAYPDGWACATFTGSSNATHLGKTTESGLTGFDVTAFLTAGCGAEYGSDTLTAANGDHVFITFIGSVCKLNDEGTAGQDILTFQITGGTGRFVGATGAGNVLSQFQLTSTSSGVATTTYTGAISSPGATH